MIRLALPLALLPILAACGDDAAAPVIEDPSTINAELEADARQIEARAAEAVAEAERDAARQLDALKAEATAEAASDDAGAVPNDPVDDN